MRSRRPSARSRPPAPDAPGLAEAALREEALARVAAGTVEPGDIETGSRSTGEGARERAEMAVLHFVAGARLGSARAVAESLADMALGAGTDAPIPDNLIPLLGRAAARARVGGVEVADAVARRAWQAAHPAGVATALSDLPFPVDGRWPEGRPDTRRARARRSGGAMGIALELEVALDAELRGALGTALAAYGTVIAVDPDRLEAWTGIRRVARAGGDLLGEARALARLGALIRDPERAAGLLAEAASAYERALRRDDAITALAKAVEMRPDDPVLYQRVYDLLRADLDVPGRSMLFDNLLSHRLAAAALAPPARAALLYERAQHRLQRLGEREAAFTDLKQILSIVPEHRKRFINWLWARSPMATRSRRRSGSNASLRWPGTTRVRPRRGSISRPLTKGGGIGHAPWRRSAARPRLARATRRRSIGSPTFNCGQATGGGRSRRCGPPSPGCPRPGPGPPCTCASAPCCAISGAIRWGPRRRSQERRSSIPSATEYGPWSRSTTPPATRPARSQRWSTRWPASGTRSGAIRWMCVCSSDWRSSSGWPVRAASGRRSPRRKRRSRACSACSATPGEVSPPSTPAPFAPRSAPAFWAELVHPAAGGFVAEIWPNLLEAAAALFPAPAPRERRSALSAGAADAGFAWIQGVGRAIGLPEIQLYTSRETGVAPAMAIEEPAAAIVLAAGAARAPGLRFHVGRSVGFAPPARDDPRAGERGRARAALRLRGGARRRGPAGRASPAVRGDPADGHPRGEPEAPQGPRPAGVAVCVRAFRPRRLARGGPSHGRSARLARRGRRRDGGGRPGGRIVVTVGDRSGGVPGRARRHQHRGDRSGAIRPLGSFSDASPSGERRAGRSRRDA